MATPNIDRALFASRQQLTSLERNGSADGYTYAKADDVIKTCLTVLLSNGLMVRRRDFAVTADGSKTLSTFIVSHPESGERELASAEFPVTYDKDEPDKCVAASLTTAWGYWLRDTLALPRHDGNEMDSRAVGSASVTSQAPLAAQATTGGRRLSAAPPVRAADEIYDPDNARHREQARLTFEDLNVRSQQLREKISLDFLVGRPMRDVDAIIRNEVQAYWKKCQSAAPARSWRSWRGGRR